MKRRIELQIDELRLPPGSRGGERALAAIRRHLETLLRHGAAAPLPQDANGAVARGIHDAVAAQLPREKRL